MMITRSVLASERVDVTDEKCIDVSKELESCGGCMEGQFYAPNATAGLE
jgi:hypothetical protein